MATVQKLQVKASNFPISITLHWDLFLSSPAPVEVPHWLLLLIEAVTCTSPYGYIYINHNPLPAHPQKSESRHMENSCSSHSRTVEITVLSAEDLRVDGRSVKKKAFAVVKLDPFNNRVTKVDAVGGGYPAWDEKLVMKLPTHVTFITLEVQYRTSSGSGDRLVGRATLPVSDFIGGYVPENHLNFLSYLLRDARGIRSGIINVSVRVKEGSGLGLLKSRYEYGSSSPSAQQKPVIGADGKKFSGLVAGIPVWNPYPV